ncbi:MAG: SemiSWEET transporter [Terracidiphilus sp.]
MTAPWIPEAIGSAAGFCTTVSLVPQLLRIWRNKSARDLSLAMFLVFSMGILLWLTYGIVVGSPSVIAANGASLFLSIGIITLALRYRRAQGKASEEG